MPIDLETDPVGTRSIDPVPRPVDPGAVGGPLFPVGLVVKGRRCLVVGGGRTAARKVRALVQCGAVVTVVAPEVQAVLQLRSDLAATGGPGAGGPGAEGEACGEGSVDLQVRTYRQGEAAGYRLVVAATGDPHVDAAVYEDAEAAGVWVNAADDPVHCSMVLPAVWRDGAVTVSVSTDGTSPALASWLRTQVAEAVGQHVGELAVVLGQARRRLKEEGRPTESVDWLAILEGPVPGLVAEGRLSDAQAEIAAALGFRENREDGKDGCGPS